jgi:tryptophan-rich sensory protein
MSNRTTFSRRDFVRSGAVATAAFLHLLTSLRWFTNIHPPNMHPPTKRCPSVWVWPVTRFVTSVARR